jgi:hypothetical protein
MNMSARTGSVHVQSLAIETADRHIGEARTINVAPRPHKTSTSHIMVAALGLGGVLTILWAGALLWLAGYLIGFW